MSCSLHFWVQPSAVADAEGQMALQALLSDAVVDPRRHGAARRKLHQLAWWHAATWILWLNQLLCGAQGVVEL